MTAPLVASTIARVIGYEAVLAVIVAVGVALSAWLGHTTRELRAAVLARAADEVTSAERVRAPRR